MAVWLNGTIVEEGAAAISPGDRGFTLGDGLFETMAVRNGRILRLDAHRARLEAGARVLELPLPPLDLEAVAAAVLRANGLSDAALRLTVTRGSGPRGVLPPARPSPTVLLAAAPFPAPVPPAACVTATVTRRNEHSPLSRIKCLNYLDNILARQEAQRRGADDAILLNTAGRVAEATAATLFVVCGGRLLTPPVSDGALPGVLRAAVLERDGEEAPLTPAALAACEEAFLTSSLGLRPVAAIDGRPLPRVGEGPARLGAGLFPPESLLSAG